MTIHVLDLGRYAITLNETTGTGFFKANVRDRSASDLQELVIQDRRVAPRDPYTEMPLQVRLAVQRAGYTV